MHIELDGESENGLKGLPDEWKKMLENAGLDDKDIKENPAMMMGIINNIEDKFDNELKRD
jgi:hypothetical protein